MQIGYQQIYRCGRAQWADTFKLEVCVNHNLSVDIIMSIKSRERDKDGKGGWSDDENDAQD